MHFTLNSELQEIPNTAMVLSGIKNTFEIYKK